MTALAASPPLEILILGQDQSWSLRLCPLSPESRGQEAEGHVSPGPLQTAGAGCAPAVPWHRAHSDVSPALSPRRDRSVLDTPYKGPPCHSTAISATLEAGEVPPLACCGAPGSVHPPVSPLPSIPSGSSSWPAPRRRHCPGSEMGAAGSKGQGESPTRVPGCVWRGQGHGMLWPGTGSEVLVRGQ